MAKRWKSLKASDRNMGLITLLPLLLSLKMPNNASTNKCFPLNSKTFSYNYPPMTSIRYSQTYHFLHKLFQFVLFLSMTQASLAQAQNMESGFCLPHNQLLPGPSDHSSLIPFSSLPPSACPHGALFFKSMWRNPNGFLPSNLSCFQPILQIHLPSTPLYVDIFPWLPTA